MARRSASATTPAVPRPVGDAVATPPPPRLAMLLPQGCAAPAANAEEDCAQDIHQEFGLRAFRRPLTDRRGGRPVRRSTPSSARRRYRRQLRRGHPGADRRHAAVARTSCTAGNWRGAPSATGRLVKLNSYEIASRLSYFFWARCPTTRCSTPPAAGELQTTRPDRRAGPADDGRPRSSRIGLERLLVQWLGVTGLPTHGEGRSFTNYAGASASR